MTTRCRIARREEAFPSLRRLAVLANPLHPGEKIEKLECEAVLLGRIRDERGRL